MRSYARGVAAVTLMAAALVACGDDGDDTASSGTSTSTSTSAGPTSSTGPVTTASATTQPTAASTTVTTRGGPTTTAAPACPVSALPAGASDVTTGTGDFDGDGKADTLRAYRDNATWHLRAELGAGGAADATVVPSGPSAVKAIGGVNFGKPGDVALATIGSGASTVTVGLYYVSSCQVRRVANEESAATFPIGASVANYSGLECTDYGNDGTPNLVWLRATSADGVTYRATSTIYAYSGSSIATVAPGVVGPVDIAANSPQLQKYATLTCGGLKLP